MPKRLIEINKFTGGIVSTPSATDTDEQSAKYSLNIDPQTSDGRLQGIDSDKYLTSAGFAGTGTALSVNYVKALQVATDKQNPNKINLVIGKGSNLLNDYIDTISIVQDLYNTNNVVQINLETNLNSLISEYDFQSNDDKVFVGLGGSQSTSSKVVMTPSGKTISGGDKGGVDLFDAELIPPSLNEFSGMFSEFMSFPIHGQTTAIAKNDSKADSILPDYDFSLDADLSGGTLHTYIAANSVTAGQILKLHSSHTNDFSDSALLNWKKYDYNQHSSGALDNNDLFMYCGNTSEGAPILRFIGNFTDQNPAFIYAIKEENTSIYKISTTTEADANAFASGNITISKNTGTASSDLVTIPRQTSRITSLNISSLLNWEGDYISAISGCSSPPLYNNIGLVDDGVEPHTTGQNTFHNNGYLQILYRNSVFYVASRNSTNKLYRLNAIDFYSLTSSGPLLEDMVLDFTKIPDQLHAEDGKGIVRRTIEDQLLEPPEDPQQHAWSNIPANAEIIGICETFDCGKLDEVKSESELGRSYSSVDAFRFKTKNKSRLTTGDKVRFAGMKIDGTDSAKHINFNLATPYEVSVVEDGKYFWVDAVDSNAKKPALDADLTAMWWSSKVWILYGKKTNSASFDKWDLFLYNANTLDITSSRSIHMADRTPPFQQARYYETETVTGSVGKVWYPGQFAFIKKDPTPGYNGDSNTDEQDYSTQGLQSGDVRNPGASIFVEGDETSGNYCEWGIYDKSGRWANNGVRRVVSSHNHTPIDWVGGRDGPSNSKINGELIFGNNIGWSTEEGQHRQVKPVKNSVHPLVPYSTLYNGNLVYSGYNSSTITNFLNDESSTSGEYQKLNTDITSMYNRPKHAVTFIGKVKGTFVVQPGKINRYNLSGPSNQSNDDMDRGFVVDTSFEKLKTYDDDYTLFTIDDFSGHRGSVIDENNANSLNLTSVSNSNTTRDPLGGPQIHRPNFGGPDIENSLYREFYDEYGTHSFPNKNGGYSASDGDSNDKGWDGYDPPYLFTPGNGYYVYINRSWQSMSNYAKKGGLTTSTVWGFNSYVNDGDYALSPGRGNNLSSTALADSFYTVKDNLPDPPYQMKDDIERQFHTGYAPNVMTRFYSRERENHSQWNFEVTYSTSPANVEALCTMHKISVEDMGEINSIFPMVFNSTVNPSMAAGGSVQFVSGYICGTKRNTTNGSGALILRTNFDDIWDKYREMDAMDGYIMENTLYTHHTPAIEADNAFYPIFRRGSHGAEIINITDSNTNYTPNADNIEGLQMEQSAIDKYNNVYTGNKLILASITPLKGFAAGNNLSIANSDWFVQMNARNSSSLYLGWQDNAFTMSTGNTYTEDLQGNFFSGDIFTGAGTSGDATILTETIGSVIFDNTVAEGTTGNLVEGDYYYKLAYEYDNIYHSPLTQEAALKTLSPSTAGNRYEYNKFTLSLTSGNAANIPARVTGICVYRKYEGGDDDAYSLVTTVKLSDSWIYNSTNDTYNIDVYDKDTLMGTYFANNGIDETLENTSLNYGLSAVFQGYLFVTKAFHPNLEDVKRYIFRSQPDNFFTFNWIEDFVIMPETPIAMVSFNSRLYVWGQNALYKLDPFSMLIEDTYEGVSIVNKDSFVKTEYGLCFMDKNNVYIHDGNKPVAIADAILYSSNDSIVYNTDGTDGYIKLQQGYRELVEQTITNKHKPHLTYSGKHNSFLIHLSDASTDGKTFAFNLNKRRWDLWDSPKPYAITTSKDSDIIIADGNSIYNYIKLESEEFTDYNRRTWDWFSKDINFGTDTQDKVFRSIKFLGTPSIYNNNEDALPAIYNATSNNKITSVQAYVDNDLVKLTVKDKFYETINLGQSYLENTINRENKFYIKTEILSQTSSGAGGADGYQGFIQPGHLIKIEDEIMLVKSITNNISNVIVETIRGVMGTTSVAHSIGTNISVSIVSPILKFPAGTKGKNLSIRLIGQKGYIDSVGVVYKPKSIK